MTEINVFEYCTFQFEIELIFAKHENVPMDVFYKRPYILGLLSRIEDEGYVFRDLGHWERIQHEDS